MIVLVINDEDITIFNLKSYTPITIYRNRPSGSSIFLAPFERVETISFYIHIVYRFCRIKCSELCPQFSPVLCLNTRRLSRLIKPLEPFVFERFYHPKNVACRATTVNKRVT